MSLSSKNKTSAQHFTMVQPTAMPTEPQIFTINNVQDVFDILSRGFDVYNKQGSSATGNKISTQPETPKAEHNGVPSSQAAVTGHKRRSYQPDLDIAESSDAILIDVSLPGVDKASINIEYDAKENQIVLSGEFRKPDRQAELKIIRHERPGGKYERIVLLGQQVILPDQISAQYTDGVLTVTVPKNKEVELKKKIHVV